MKKRILSLLIVLSMLCSLMLQGMPTVSAVVESDTGSDNLTWTFDDEAGLLTISGTGSVGSEKPWLDYAELITSLEIQEGITEIADYAFTELCNLTEATLPESLRKIGSGVFSGCYSLKSVTVLSPDCDIAMYSFALGHSFETVIYGHVPSTAQQYAENAQQTFRALCDHSFTDGLCIHCGRSNTITIPGSDGLIWEINIETSTLTVSGNGVAQRPELGYLAPYAKSLVIKEGVTGIGDRAFYGFNSLTSVSLPTGITEIGQWAFYACVGLASITIPNSVETIEEYAFSNCDGLTSITIPNSVETIKESAFCNCDGLASITIPNSVRTIGDYTFSECVSLTEVTIPVGITSIGWGVFSDCSGLVSATLPADMTTIPEDIFYNCENLESITIPESVTTIGPGAFRGCSALTSITIPESVTTIGASAFSECNALTSITIPESVTEIGYGAFSDCDGLVSMAIPNSLTEIPDGIFRDCTGLKSVTIPDGVTCIGYDAFSGCSELTNITIPDSVTSIGSAAFSNCDGLTSIIIPDGVTSIPSGLFDSCSNLTDVVLPDTITRIDYDAFANCDALTNIAIPHSVTSIGSDAFINCTSLTELELPEGLTQIEYRAFCGCTGLTSITFPANLTYISTQAFDGCTGLTEITIPDTVTRIDSHAFWHCSNLKNITLPDHALYIGERAFEETAYYNDPNSWKEDVLYIGKHLIEAKTAKTGVCEILNGTVSIADGAFRNCQDLTEVIIPDGITRIPAYTFENCSSLESVTVPDTVSVIEYSAFAGCSSLKNVTIPEGVSAICGYTFAECSALEHITIPESVTEIAHNAFYGCAALRSVTIPGSVANIRSYAFEGCTGLENVTIHEGVTCIEYCAFTGCAGLTEAVLPNSLEHIGASVFENCTALERAVIPGSLKYIGEYIFTNCSSLKDVTLHNGLPKISWGMFQNCTSLTEILIPDSVTEIGIDAFTDCITLSSITLPEHEIIIDDAFTGTAYYNDINNWENDILYIGKHLIKANPGITGEYVIADGTLTVAGYAFSECTGLTGISIPNSVANLCNSAFYGCTGLERVTVPHSVQAIHNRVFANCTNLSEIVLPDTALAINSRAFHETAYYRNDNNWSDNMLYIGKHLVSGNPYKISDCVVREGTLTIADYAFWVDITRSTSMDTLTLPDSLLRIGASAFANAGGFQEVTIPKNVQSIGDMAFIRAVTNAITILNPNCAIADSEYTFEPWDVEPLVLYGYEGSTIHAYAEEYGYPFVALDPKPIVDENIQMGHSLNLANDISINFVVPAEQLDGYDSYYMECVSTVGKTAEKRSTGGMRIDPIRSGDYYYFVLDGITSIEMNDVYEATLHMTKDGVAYVSTLDSYSVADYAYSQLNKPNHPESLKRVCANMLQYGAAAQIWKNYRTDALATERMTEEHKAYLVDPSTVVFGDNNARLNDIDNPTIKWIGKSLSLESKVVIRFIIDATNWKDRLHELSLHVTYKTLEGTTETVVIDTCEEYLLERNFYSFSFDSLRAAELRSVVSAAVYHGDTQISTTTQYSVDSYGNGKTGTMLTLCQAMIAYSDTALAFFS